MLDFVKVLKGELKLPNILRFREGRSTLKNIKVIGITSDNKLVVYDDFFTVEEVLKLKNDLELYDSSVKFFDSSDNLIAAITITDGVVDLLGANVAKSNGDNLITDINGIVAGNNGSLVLPLPFKYLTTSSVSSVIKYDKEYDYGSLGSPIIGLLTNDLTNAIIGNVQKIYSNHSVSPFPANWVKVSGTYKVSEVNLIYAEWESNTRIIYWIINLT